MSKKEERRKNWGKNSKFFFKEKERRIKSVIELDELQKKCYSSIMENIELVNQTIAKNLIFYRKAAGLTQAEVAQKINYSDKSVSKWESGNGVPDIPFMRNQF